MLRNIVLNILIERWGSLHVSPGTARAHPVGTHWAGVPDRRARHRGGHVHIATTGDLQGTDYVRRDVAWHFKHFHGVP